MLLILETNSFPPFAEHAEDLIPLRNSTQRDFPIIITTTMACGKDPEELQDTLEKLASRAASLYERGQALKDKSCQNGNHGIEGINKLMKKIQAEQSFIRSVSVRPFANSEYVKGHGR